MEELPEVQGKCQAQNLFAAVIDEDVLRYQFVKKKGYVRLHTNKGDLNLELHCDLVSMWLFSGGCWGIWVFKTS